MTFTYFCCSYMISQTLDLNLATQPFSMEKVHTFVPVQNLVPKNSHSDECFSSSSHTSSVCLSLWNAQSTTGSGLRCLRARRTAPTTLTGRRRTPVWRRRRTFCAAWWTVESATICRRWRDSPVSLKRPLVLYLCLWSPISGAHEAPLCAPLGL